MAYESMLREMFQGVDLGLEDLYLLEGFQIGYLPERVPHREFAAVLWENASIKQFLVVKHPPIASFIEDVMARHGPAANQQDFDAYSDRLLWEIADQFIYAKYPEVYDEKARVDWRFDAVTANVPLEHKVVIDAGAGTGLVAFAAAQTARLVFAVEPGPGLRQFIREKAARTGTTNLFAIDGFLHAIPLPEGFADVLITARAIGWHLEDELQEIERVVKKGGYALHLGASEDSAGSPLHRRLTSPEWQYTCSQYEDGQGRKLQYWKQI